MATQVLRTRFQVRRGYREAWERNNRVLACGEPGFVIDLGKLKIGDGVTPWNELKYIGEEDTTFSVEPDGFTITYNSENKLVLAGFEEALPNQIPMKDESGNLVWVTMEAAGAEYIDDLKQRDTIVFYGGKAPLPTEEDEVDV